ncbi:MAG: peptidylprolyl isomerase [Ruminococcus sp.]|uniref:PPIC-type PPIASE domain-containing protein n=1 Tax=Ruminococcus albus TaxID=1264 RepID=A0A1H7GZ50_RUMAL|nr:MULTISPECIES: peptidylprolyl isomerase [Ruminococcus]MBO4867340.1 peptidylprolyl isomerase [Ruminococcus sp.]SEK43436.1 PPIC-type PPIASE domain-containing protein [Ruminococcus albus]
MLKKMMAVLLAMTLCVGSMAGCSNKDKKDKDKKSSETTTNEDEAAGPQQEEVLPVASLTIDGEEIDTTDYVMCNIDGIDISFDLFRFFYFEALAQYEQFGIDANALRTNDETYQAFLNYVIDSIKNRLVTDKLAETHNIELDDEDQKVIDGNLRKCKEEYSNEEEFQKEMQRSHLTYDVLERMFINAQTYNKVMATLFDKGGQYATTEEDFLKLIQDPEEYAHAVYVMIPFYSQVELDDSTAATYDDKTLSQKISAKNNAYNALDADAKAAEAAKAKTVAEDVLKRAQDGEDFTQLIEEYGWDTELDENPKNGYYMRRDNTGGFPKAMLDEVFSLKPGQVSENLIEDGTYGYFIVKRLEPDMNYINENIDTMIATHDQPMIQKMFTETMDAMTVTYCGIWDKLTYDSIT